VRRASPILLLLALLPAHIPAGDKFTWEWHETHTELYSPRFSPTGNEIVLVRKWHIPDGGEAVGLPPEKLFEHRPLIERDNRYADPEILMLPIGGSEPTRIDWGWDPEFSPDGREIAYAFQKKPISGYRVLAATMAGNDIRVYRRDDKTTRTIAEPASGYLTKPIFSPDGKQVAYSMADAINGAWGGVVGIGRASLDGSSGQILYAATKTLDQYHLVSQKQYVGTRLFALVLKPLEKKGDDGEDLDLPELFEVGPPARTIRTWKPQSWHDRKTNPAAFSATSSGLLYIHDKGWNKLTMEKPGTITPLRERPLGVLSPDGLLQAVSHESTVDIRRMQTHRSVDTFKVPGEVQEVSWSPDSQRVAVIWSKEFEYDGLTVFLASP